MNLILGKPERRTDWSDNHVQDITGYDVEAGDFKDVAAVLIYLGHYFILEHKDGKFWTIAERSEAYGTLEECEKLLGEFVRGECGGAVMYQNRHAAPMQLITEGTDDEPIFLCTWNDGQIIEVHTFESLHAAYHETNLFDEAEWFNVHGTGWRSETLPVKSLLTSVEVGDAFKCENCQIQRIK